MSRKLTTENFIKKAILIHGNKYDYSLVEYIRNRNKIKIICPIHGIFEQIAANHLNGCICKKCSKRTSLSQFIDKAMAIHGNKYDYSLVEYNTNKDHIIIICKEHGIFTQRPDNHINLKHGCPKCKSILLSNMWNDKKFSENVKYKQINGVINKYGVSNVMHDAIIANHCFKQSLKYKNYILPSGKIIEIQGYENKILDELLLTYNEDDIVYSRKDMPLIWYYYKNKKHRYYPDFYIPKDNLIIEVKCEYTYNSNLEKNKAKFNSTLALGYKFRLEMFDNKGKVKLS